MTTQQTQTEQNKSLVRRYYEEVGNAATADIASAGADRLLSNDFTFYPPNAAEGEQGLDNLTGAVGRLRLPSTGANDGLIA